jgi:hypothetical protein
VAGVVCSLYRVAARRRHDLCADRGLSAGAQVGLDGLETDAAGWQTAAADSLAVYAAADVSGVEPDGQGTSDGSGNLSFAGLSTGLYLAVFARRRPAAPPPTAFRRICWRCPNGMPAEP